MFVRRRGERGSALLELALVMPLLLWLSAGVVDVGEIIADTTHVGGAVRAAIRSAEKSLSNDIGATIRGENGASTNTANTWGLAWTGSADDCSPTRVGAKCGDPGACEQGSDFWKTAGTGGVLPTQCFSIASCTITAGPPPGCTPDTSSWGTRPAAGSASETMLVVRVALKAKPLTPLISTFVPGGYFYVTDTGYAAPQY